MRPVVLTGIGAGQPERDRNWDFNRQRWWELRWPVCAGHYHEPGPFSMAVASNRAVKLADAIVPDWDVALYVGADFALLDLSRATTAVEVALASGELTIAHSETVMLDEEQTRHVVAGEPLLRGLGPVFPNPFTGVSAFPRSLIEAVGGFDERFVGWGWEDQAFWASCWAIGGGFSRCDGTAFHLWHPTSRDEKEDSPTYAANEVLGRRYLAAKRNPDQTRRIIEERP